MPTETAPDPELPHIIVEYPQPTGADIVEVTFRCSLDANTETNEFSGPNAVADAKAYLAAFKTAHKHEEETLVKKVWDALLE